MYHFEIVQIYLALLLLEFWLNYINLFLFAEGVYKFGLWEVYKTLILFPK